MPAMSWPAPMLLMSCAEWAEWAAVPARFADLAAAPSPSSEIVRTVTLIVCGLFAMPSRSRYFFATATVAVYPPAGRSTGSE